MRLKERVALVSAMASGIGQAIAERFAAEGAAIIGVDVDEKGGVSTARESARTAAAFYSTAQTSAHKSRFSKRWTLDCGSSEKSMC